MKVKLCIAPILALFIFHTFASVSLASRDDIQSDPSQDLKQCEQQCQKRLPYFDEVQCRDLCEKLSEREKGESGGGRFTADVGDAEVEYEKCQRSCPGSGQKQWQCQRRCQDRYEADLEREREERGHHGDRGREGDHDRGGDRGRGGDHGRGGDRYPREDSYRRCIRDCDDEEEGFPRQRQCKLHCEEKYGHSDRRSARDYANAHHKKSKKESENPYYFDSESFETRFSTEEGTMRVLQRFSDKSDVLLGIDGFRVGFYDANPQTFMLPHHWDADSILFVLKGNATMKFSSPGNHEMFDLQRGDVLAIPAGTTTYLVSTHEDEKLEIAELLRPVNIPGQYEQFFGVGGEEAFYNGFSNELLEAALDIPLKQLKTVFKQQQGAVVRIRREQVRALSQHMMSRREMEQSENSPFNLLNEGLKFVNEYGEFFQVSPNDYKQLQELDVSVAHCNLRQGSMMAPHYNSRTTKIIMVEEGSGYIEMLTPHMGRQHNKKDESKEKGSISYKKVKVNLSKGDVFVVPSGYPVAMVASENEDLKCVGFGINARNNQMNFLAGRGNIINELDREAMELSFGMSAEEVEQIFSKQEEAFFLPGPQRKGRPSVVGSILEFAGF